MAQRHQSELGTSAINPMMSPAGIDWAPGCKQWGDEGHFSRAPNQSNLRSFFKAAKPGEVRLKTPKLGEKNKKRQNPDILMIVVYIYIYISFLVFWKEWEMQPANDGSTDLIIDRIYSLFSLSLI